MPYNDITKTLFYNTRIILSAELIQPLAWRVTKVEPFATRGNIMYTFKEDVFNQHFDYIERDNNGKLIGAWADYWNDDNLPSDNPLPSPIPIENGYHAEISYAGTEPHIKVGGSYKKITLTYYHYDEVANDQTPGDWSYWIDDTDVSDFVKVLETNESNTIKIKWLGDENFLGKVLIIKNKRNNITAELQLQIVSL